MAKNKLMQMNNEKLWQLFPIIIKPHCSAWLAWYKKEAKKLQKGLGNKIIVRMHHIGSTAVDGLDAKPTIDILLEINHLSDLDKLRKKLEKQGYLLTHQPDNPPPHMHFLKGYTLRGFKRKIFHLHIRYPGDWDELYFRDYLKDYPDVCRLYGKLKNELCRIYRHDRDAYTREKTDFIKQHTEQAKKMYAGRYQLATVYGNEKIGSRTS